MNEEIEYAEMLEIPVSTVNVVRKSRHHKKTDRASAGFAHNEEPLKDTVLANVNDRLRENATPATQDADAFESNFQQEGDIDFDSPERIDTVRLYSAKQGDSLYPYDYQLTDGKKKDSLQPSKAMRIALGVEFGLACALCGAIFLTNVFVPGSAVNTFFRALNAPTSNTAAARPYTDFTLGAIVSEFADAELSLSPTGILTFTDDCCVYPAADGTVSEVSKNTNGGYTLKVNYSDSFTGVFQGLDVVYYNVGDSVKTNVPVGYTAGETEVQVTMYSDGLLLNCFELTDENCLAWLPTQNTTQNNANK